MYDFIKHIDTLGEIITATAVCLVALAALFKALAALVRVVEKFTKLTPSPKDDAVVDAVADSLEDAAKAVDGKAAELKSVKLK